MVHGADTAKTTGQGGLSTDGTEGAVSRGPDTRPAGAPPSWWVPPTPRQGNEPRTEHRRPAPDPVATAGDQTLTTLPAGRWYSSGTDTTPDEVADHPVAEGGDGRRHNGRGGPGPRDEGGPGAGHTQVWVPEPAPAAHQPVSATATSVAVRRPAARHTGPLGRPADSPSPHGRSQPNVERSFAALEPVDAAEATQVAVTFAMDYTSWDEAEPTHRSEALRRYLPCGADTTLGWGGAGRQRADFAAAGALRWIGYAVLVDVRVRVTPYTHNNNDGNDDGDGDDGHPPTSAPTPAALPARGAWSSAPAPTAPAWTAGRSFWLRLAVPVRRHDSGGLVVDLSPVPEPDFEVPRP